ncbi:MAG: hypothetical protein DWQ36_01405 [Acidobacteria bacterium]|nr:MAG: hypothetical protein DWQ30_14195 [Acidobacteriota bacterium]REK11668.1 MAG: hypothetical protein DWQ36_01405 [Acidobacteriota bacterium]
MGTRRESGRGAADAPRGGAVIVRSIQPGSIVIVHLQSPTEKFWGVLLSLDAIGLQLRGLNITSFDDWMGQAARGESALLGPATMFMPLIRVERLFLDEQIGSVESYRQRFEQRVGLRVEEFLGLAEAGGEIPS